MRKAHDFLSGGPLLVVGLGGVGMMGLSFARAMYDGPVYVADINKEVRNRALEMGAAAAFDPREPEARKHLYRATGHGAGAVIDFVGSANSLHFSQSAATKGGAVIVVGLMGGSFTIPAPLIPMRALTIRGSYVGSLAEAHDMLDCVRSGKVGPIPVTEMCLEEATDALDILRRGGAIGRIVLRPS
jgi:D-arabinose 1-dehydrogenase-like Zn-dependent alcohol dehydrogenase